MWEGERIKINWSLKSRTMAGMISMRAEQLELVKRKLLSNTKLKFKRTKVLHLQSGHLKDIFLYKELLQFIPAGFCWSWNFTWIHVFRGKKKNPHSRLTTTCIQKYPSHRWLAMYLKRSFLTLGVFFCSPPWTPFIDQSWLAEPLLWLDTITQATHYPPESLGKFWTQHWQLFAQFVPFHRVSTG